MQAKLATEQIESINKKCPYNQGIFFQPYGIPVKVKEPVIYSRYEKGGYSGGSYHGGKSKPYSKEKPDNHLVVLDFILEEIMPNITFLQYKRILRAFHTNEETQHEYYGNSSDYHISYLSLSEFFNIIKSF